MAGQYLPLWTFCLENILVILREPQPVKRIDDTPLPENESECPCCAKLAVRVAEMAAALAMAQVELADLHFSKRVSREQAEDTDPEWY